MSAPDHLPNHDRIMPNTNHPGSHDRHTYLLSLWREGTTWRAALRPADDGPRLGFGDLEQLVAYILRLQDERYVADSAVPVREGGSGEHDGTR